MSIPYHVYDEETRQALMSAMQIMMDEGLDDDLKLAEMAEEIGMEFDETSVLTRRGQLSVAVRVPVVAEKKKEQAMGRLRRRLMEKGVCGQAATA